MRVASFLNQMSREILACDVISLSAAMPKHVKSGQWQRVSPLHDLGGVSPDVISFSAAISAC
eukprot:3541726-Karenia_brevis.AAC.1